MVISSLDVSAGCSRPVARVTVTQPLNTLVLVIGIDGEYVPTVMRINDGVLQHGMS